MENVYQLLEFLKKNNINFCHEFRQTAETVRIRLEDEYVKPNYIQARFSECKLEGFEQYLHCGDILLVKKNTHLHNEIESSHR